jgi:hypothetical protein
MKQYINWISLAVCGLILIASSCQKKDYLIDEGIHNPKSSLDTYEYLKQHSWKMFDTLIILVDHFNLKEEMNDAATVFAPTDYSIRRYIDIRQSALRVINESLVYNLDSLKKDMKADSVRQYFFGKKITLAEAKINPEVDLVTSHANTSCAVSKELLTTSPQNFVQFSSTPTYALLLTFVRGALDIPGVVPPLNENDINVRCQTTGIEPASGGILHVLNNQHTFSRF